MNARDSVLDESPIAGLLAMIAAKGPILMRTGGIVTQGFSKQDKLVAGWSLSEEQQAEIVRLYFDSGLSIRAISRHTGFSQPTVSKYVKIEKQRRKK